MKSCCTAVHVLVPVSARACGLRQECPMTGILCLYVAACELLTSAEVCALTASCSASSACEQTHSLAVCDCVGFCCSPETWHMPTVWGPAALAPWPSSSWR